MKGFPMKWWSHPRILVVDDSFAIRRALEENLSKFEAVVVHAADGRQGFEIAEKGNFDLIITDIDMPEMDGWSLCKRLKEDPKTQSVPVIVLSSCSEEKEIWKSYQCGASAYVAKSEAENELDRCVAELLFRSSQLRGRYVLVVDDNRTIRILISESLKQKGFEVETAENGKKALLVMKEKKPDLIISDLHMPEMDGITFFEAINKEMEYGDIPFIVASVVDDSSVMRRMIQKGASAYLVKPFNIEQLVITVEKILGDHYRMLKNERDRFSLERNLMLGSISSLIQALEARDRYTRGHSEQVAKIAVTMGKKWKLSQEDIEDIDIAAKLHDIGKIGLRDELLLKKGELSEEEFEIVKKHPVIGSEILRPIPSLSRVIPAVLSHHERMDGTGYPEGLAGDQIPFFARIIAVADTYHALTSDRPYRDRLTGKNALDIIESVSGEQLCPDCVDVFLAVMEETDGISLREYCKPRLYDPVL